MKKVERIPKLRDMLSYTLAILNSPDAVLDERVHAAILFACAKEWLAQEKLSKDGGEPTRKEFCESIGQTILTICGKSYQRLYGDDNDD